MPVVAAVLALSGCGNAVLLVDAASDAALADVMAPRGPDAHPHDAAAPDTGAPDASIVGARLPDADPCTDCVASSECLEPVCDGVCGERPIIDGTVCGGSDATICVAGECVTRACGDG
jgi:hypothetical protein